MTGYGTFDASVRNFFNQCNYTGCSYAVAVEVRNVPQYQAQALPFYYYAYMYNGMLTGCLSDSFALGERDLKVVFNLTGVIRPENFCEHLLDYGDFRFMGFFGAYDTSSTSSIAPKAYLPPPMKGQ